MEKKTAIGISMMALAMAAMANDDVYRIDNPSSRIKPSPLKKPFKTTPFKEQDGVIRTIIEYKLVQSGQSKQGPVKQARTISKIKDWIDKGFLTKEDLT